VAVEAVDDLPEGPALILHFAGEFLDRVQAGLGVRFVDDLVEILEFVEEVGHVRRVVLVARTAHGRADDLECLKRSAWAASGRTVAVERGRFKRARPESPGMTAQGWFAGVDPDDAAAAGDAVRTGRADAPEDWPALAVEAGAAGDEDEYYELLHDATLAGTRAAVRERESADDQQLIHAVRAMADPRRRPTKSPSAARSGPAVSSTTSAAVSTVHARWPAGTPRRRARSRQSRSVDALQTSETNGTPCARTSNSRRPRWRRTSRRSRAPCSRRA